MDCVCSAFDPSGPPNKGASEAATRTKASKRAANHSLLQPTASSCFLLLLSPIRGSSKLASYYRPISIRSRVCLSCTTHPPSSHPSPPQVQQERQAGRQAGRQQGNSPLSPPTNQSITAAARLLFSSTAAAVSCFCVCVFDCCFLAFPLSARPGSCEAPRPCSLIERWQGKKGKERCKCTHDFGSHRQSHNTHAKG